MERLIPAQQWNTSGLSRPQARTKAIISVLMPEEDGPGGGDESENIIVHEVPRTQAGQWLFARAAEGYSIDPKLFAGLWFIEHAGLKIPS